MAEKDLTERDLEEYDDVFADIVNVLLFDGMRVVNPDELEDSAPRSTYLANGSVRGMERDVCKRWSSGGARIAFVGLENQSESDRDMPLRVMAYDGAEYRSQLLKKGGDKTRYPVVTLVLYFGGNRRWSGPTTLRAALTIPEGLGRWVQDYGVNLVELAWLPHDRVDEFQSDFRAVVEYLVQKRETGNYTPERRRLNHVGETLRLLSAVSGDSRFEDVAGGNDDERGVSDMCEVLDRIEARGIEIGEARGEARGKKLMVEGMLREKIPIDVIARVSSMGYDAIRSLAASIGASVVS